MDTPHLEIDAHVVRQLGEELITDSEQALLELVKNSYDADAEWCSVTIDTNYEETVSPNVPPITKEKEVHENETNKSEFSHLKTLHGRIVIEDNGCGMSLSGIKHGWLTISISPKRAMKQRKEVTPRFKRTPLGDKGLGRLGTMRLGDRLVIRTHHNPSEPGIQVTIFWSACISGQPLGSVPVLIEELPQTGKTGSTIEICGLSDLNYWRGASQLKILETKLSTLISPFRTFEDFTVSLDCDNKEINLISFPKRFFDTAVSNFDFVWCNGVLDLQGKVKLDIFIGEDPEFYQNHIFSDDGADFLKFLQNDKNAKQFNIKPSQSKNWFVELSDNCIWQDIVGDVTEQGRYSDPGPFLGEIHGFALNRPLESIQSVAKGIRDYNQQVKDLSGIFVYRDNFRIRLGEDWLGLGEEWTSGRSYYGLRPKNTIGYFAVTSQDNPKLIEKSDREGFVANHSWEGFQQLADRVKDFSNNALRSLRRSYNNYRKQKQNEENKAPDMICAEDTARELGELMKIAAEMGAKVKSASAMRKTILKNAQMEIKHTLASLTQSNSRLGFEAALAQIETLIHQVEEESNEVEKILNQFAEKRNYADLIMDRFSQLHEQISEVYETVGIGLSAQALAHEIIPFVDEISARARLIHQRMKRKGLSDPKLADDLEHVRAQAILVGKKLSFIDPMLRTFRQTKHKINLYSFIKDFLVLRKDRLQRFGISFYVNPEDAGTYINMNKGRLTQVLDNLTRNSEYWLRRHGQHNPKAALEIYVLIEGAKLIFWDTGPGVRPPLEEVCFDVFVSDKPKNEGHGLGLYIVKQLLEEQGCRIFLDTARNERGRRYKFVVDFTGVLEE